MTALTTFKPEIDQTSTEPDTNETGVKYNKSVLKMVAALVSLQHLSLKLTRHPLSLTQMKLE